LVGFRIIAPMAKRGIGAIIAELRGKAGLSQEELAHRASIHRTHVSQIERGLKSPTLKTLQRLAKALGVSMTKLWRMLENDNGPR
jgi:transcriptional regulator with XRE-family HTH domain